MSRVFLCAATAADAPLIEEYRAAFPAEREQVNAVPERISGLDGLEDFPDAAGWLRAAETMCGKITYYLCIREPDGRAVGALVLRHRLEYDDDAPAFRSHIGYSVRPDERRKGYAKEMLALGLQKAREAGLSRVRIICADFNTASIRTILANGGIYLDSIFGEESGLRVNRYDIPLTETEET